MNKGPRTPIIIAAGLLALLMLAATGVFAENIVAPNKYAWGENVGWVNAQPGGPGGVGVTVTDTDVKGYMWGENIGWVNLSCLTNSACGGAAGTWGVKNDGAGNLKGYAWSENAGWINFSCHTNYVTCPAPAGTWGVNINPSTGVFTGQAWGENIGWSTFSCPGSAGCGSVPYSLVTGWRGATPTATATNNDAPGGSFGGTVPPAPHWIYDGVLPEGANSGPDSTDINDDNDLSCTDVEELAGNINLGGMRDPLNPWDFADVPVPALTVANSTGTRNGVVTLSDALAVVYYSGTANNGPPNVNGVDYDTDLNGNGVEDGAEYDRTAAGPISGPPNGAVTLSDALVVVNQSGDNCTALPN